MENCRGKPPESYGDHYPLYSLFQASLFYDTDNIRIASLTCKNDSLTTESGIRTYEYRKSSAELDDCRTESEPKGSEGLAHNAEPVDKEYVEGRYTLFRPNWSDKLVRSIESPDKKDIESSGTVSKPKWSTYLLRIAEPLDKEDTEGCYTLFAPKRSDGLGRRVEPPDKEDIESSGTVSGPKWSTDLLRNAEPLDKKDIVGGYTLFGPMWSEDPVRSIKPLDKLGKKRCHTVSRPMCSEDLARGIEPLDKKDTERCHRPERSEDLACSAEPMDKKDKEHVDDVEPEPEKRIITKKELYRDPDLFQSRSEYVEPIAPQPKKPKPWGYYDWTRQVWVHKDTGKRVPMNRSEELDEEQRQAWGEAWREERRGEWRGMRGGQPGHPLAEQPRVKSGVAENMRQRMGWQGGPLGRVGDGIHHPMTTDPNNASRNAGFGKRPSAKPRLRKLSARDVFRTNVLLFIMEFVKDDTEVQLKFDEALMQSERRQIKTVINQIITDGNIELLGTIGQYDLVLDILSHNQYQLLVVSEGDEVTRWVTIYKEAPAHVYLVTPDDFLPKEEDEPDEQQSETSINQASDPDDDDNPFLRSIEKGLKKNFEKECINSKPEKGTESRSIEKGLKKIFEKQCVIKPDKRTQSRSIEKGLKKIFEKQCIVSKPENCTEPPPGEKILEFFLEFVDSEDFTEMWFLGKFTEKQAQVINELLNDLLTCMDDLDSFEGDKEIAKVFKSGEQFELKEGSNGTTEIHKVPANPPTEGRVTEPGVQARP